MPIEYEIASLDPRFNSCSDIYLKSQGYDDAELIFILRRVDRNVTKARYKVAFAGKIVGYRMVLEECRLHDWETRETNPAIGIITPSPWAHEMRAVEPLLDVHYPDARHFTISTQNECYDILTAEDPTIADLPLLT